MLAQGIVALLAVRAFHTGDQRCRGRVITHVEAGHACTDLADDTGELVAQDDGIIVGSIGVHTRHIRTADTRRFDADHDLAGTSLRCLYLFITQILIGM